VVTAKKSASSSKKTSRYQPKKKNFLTQKKKKLLFTKVSSVDLKWSEMLASYTENYSKEESFLEGGALSYLDSGQVLKSFQKPKENNEYAFVLISKNLQSPTEFMIEPISAQTQQPIKEKILLETEPTFSKKGNHYIYYFSYWVPKGTDFLRFTLNGINYHGAKSEDFALYVFSE